VPNFGDGATTVESEEVQYSCGDATETRRYVRRGGGGPAQDRVRSAGAFFLRPHPNGAISAVIIQLVESGTG